MQVFVDFCAFYHIRFKVKSSTKKLLFSDSSVINLKEVVLSFQHRHKIQKLPSGVNDMSLKEWKKTQQRFGLIFFLVLVLVSKPVNVIATQ